MLRVISPFVSKINNFLLLPSDTFLNQSRTTFILKRKWEPLLHKKNQKPRKMRAKHFVYNLVEDTLVKKRENLEVVLTKYVEGIGHRGDIVSLNRNKAYNNLLLPGLAVYKTPENIAKYAKTEADDDEMQHSSPFAQRTVNMLERLTLAVVMNKDNPWTIEPWHIRVSLRKAGYYCNDDCIILPETPITGPDMEKQNKEFNVTIVVNRLERASVKCRIHHWSTDPSARLPYVFEHWKQPAKPLET